MLMFLSDVDPVEDFKEARKRMLFLLEMRRRVLSLSKRNTGTRFRLAGMTLLTKNGRKEARRFVGLIRRVN